MNCRKETVPDDRDATIAALRERLRELEQFTPTVECINALPRAIRQYVMLLETKCDPAGDLREKVLAEDLCKQLEALVASLEQELAASKEEINALKRAP
jgi:predicted RNase H-like nuclease (RuvC/YqgF family)